MTGEICKEDNDEMSTVVKKQAKARKQRLLGSSNVRMRLICPTYDEMETDRNEEIMDEEEFRFMNSMDSVKTCNTKLTFPEFWYMYSKQLRVFICSSLGFLLYIVHNFISDEYQYLGIKLNDISGIYIFSLAQLLIIQYVIILYYWEPVEFKMIDRYITYKDDEFNCKPNLSCNFAESFHILKLYSSTNILERINVIGNTKRTIECIFLIKNIISDWFILLSIYLTTEWVISSINLLFIIIYNKLLI
ncbi:hypothetical protein cand_038400 [Cryptosporidium andersoni]|uniref:Uncharacterized protein n=1 Tax=Cryptosporidium andersoni TaxID=117008 RepID=A0A1J4MXR9_9CRYT|nr:hypothetical protein cand_038400 [Cryptosporidium andersoni]